MEAEAEMTRATSLSFQLCLWQSPLRRVRVRAAYPNLNLRLRTASNRLAVIYILTANQLLSKKPYFPPTGDIRCLAER